MCELHLKGRIQSASSKSATLSKPPGLTGKIESGSGGGITFEVGDGLKLEKGVLSVDTANKVEEDNTKPVTSAAVFVELGNVEALLANL